MAAQYLLFNVPRTGHKISKRKSPALNVIKVNHDIAKDRYYLHRRIKKWFPIDGAKRIVDIQPHTSMADMTKYQRKYVQQLIELGYNLQIAIPDARTED